MSTIREDFNLKQSILAAISMQPDIVVVMLFGSLAVCVDALCE